MRNVALLCLLAILPLSVFTACRGGEITDPAQLRGLPLEQLQAMREEILSQHSDGSGLSQRETVAVELIRDQERRLENAWIFGEWRERHGARLIFRDDGTVSVGARNGYYNELGVFCFQSAEEPAYESTWTLLYDESGDPVALVDRRDGGQYLYPFHKSRKSVFEQEGDLLTCVGTGCYFTKILN